MTTQNGGSINYGVLYLPKGKKSGTEVLQHAITTPGNGGGA